MLPDRLQQVPPRPQRRGIPGIAALQPGRSGHSGGGQQFLGQSLVGSDENGFLAVAGVWQAEVVEQGRCQVDELAVAFHRLHQVEDKERVYFFEGADILFKIEGKGHGLRLVTQIDQGAADLAGLDENILFVLGRIFPDLAVQNDRFFPFHGRTLLMAEAMILSISIWKEMPTRPQMIGRSECS